MRMFVYLPPPAYIHYIRNACPVITNRAMWINQNKKKKADALERAQSVKQTKWRVSVSRANNQTENAVLRSCTNVPIRRIYRVGHTWTNTDSHGLGDLSIGSDIICCQCTRSRLKKSIICVVLRSLNLAKSASSSFAAGGSASPLVASMAGCTAGATLMCFSAVAISTCRCAI